jgi:hypothetical protein
MIPIPGRMLKIGASLAALFLLGGVSGFSLATRHLTDPAVRARLEDRWIETRQRDDAARLKLTPDQINQVAPSYQHMLTDIRAVRESATAGVIDAVKKQGRTMWSQLTPEQQQEFLKLSEERRVRAQKRGAS